LSLAQILTVPPGPHGWEEWTFWHYTHHQAIISAAAQVKNVSLTLYNIWPFSPGNPEGWLLQHSYQHDDMNALYGVNGADLSTLDFTNAKEVEAWLWLQYQEHQSVAKLCGLPI
jgi:hypothetical protein